MQPHQAGFWNPQDYGGNAMHREDREKVLNYLEMAYPPCAPAGRGGWVNPFAK
jgi:hypothetical protein